MKKNAILLALLAASSVASANTVRQAMGTIEATVNIKGGAVQGCGHRLILVEKQPDSQGNRFAVDASVSIYSSGHALLKAGLIKFKVDKSRSIQPIESFWIKGQELRVAEILSPPGFLPSEEPKGYLLAGSSLNSAGDLLSLFAGGSGSVMVGVRPKGASLDYVLNGELSFEPADLKSFADCIGGIKLELPKAP
jgi:hypothetical protein